MLHRISIFWIAISALLTLALPAQACSIPVFRYALERWPASPYDIIIFHRGPLTDELKNIAKKFEGDEKAPPNCQVQTVDVAGEIPSPFKELWQAQTAAGAKTPWIAVCYPDAAGALPPAWSGTPTLDAAAPLLDSPARREIVRRLAAGDTAVWVLLEGGAKGEDDAAATALDAELKKLAKDLALPEKEEDEDDPRGGPQADIPLKIAFSILRVSRTDAAERMFVRLLTQCDKDLHDTKQPVVFPVFGRGRALCALTGKNLNAQAYREVSEFLTGPCSCQVKDANPGVDLLLAADWDAILEGQPPFVEPPPPLAGIPESLIPVPPAAGQSVPADAPPVTAPAGILQSLLLVLAVGLLIVVAGTVALKLRGGKKPV